MKPVYNVVIVKVKGRFEEESVYGGLHLRNRLGNFEDDPITNYKVSSGTVLGSADKFTNRLEHVLYHNAELFPQAFLPENEKNIPDGGEFIEGDQVYFHYNALSEKTIIEQCKDGTELHAIRYASVYAYHRQGELHAAQGYALLKTQYELDVEQIEINGIVQTVAMTKSGIIIDHNPKEHKRIAHVYRIGKVLPFDDKSDVKIGDQVVLKENSNWKREIDGQEYYVVKHNALYGKIVNDSIVPYGDFVAVKPDKIESTIELVNQLLTTSGTVLSKGPNTDQEIQVGDRVHFGKTEGLHTYYDEDSDVLLLKNALIFATGKADVEIKCKDFWSLI